MSGRSPRFRLFVAGLAVLALFGAAHMAGHFAGTPPPADDDQAALRRLMTTLRPPPTRRSAMEIFDGFSVFLALAPWAMAALGFVVRPLRHADPGRLRRVVWVYAVFGACATAVSVSYWFFAPTSMLACATACFVLSLCMEGRSQGGGPQRSPVPGPA